MSRGRAKRAAGARSAPAPPTARPDPGGPEELVRRASARSEPWSKLAIVLVLVFAALVFYLGMRPGGVGPILAYTYGPPIIALVALVLFVVGALWSATHRPFLGRRRLPAFAALAVLVAVASYPMPYPTSHEGRPSRVRFELPVEGTWTVRWGGERGGNALIVQPDRRYGLDLIVSEAGSTLDPDAHADAGPARYRAFGRPVLAPADGEVVLVHDGEPDHEAGALGAGHAYGNHVALRVAEGEYVFLSNLLQGSIEVAQGERVSAGQPIARVGHSGASRVTAEPHLALHLQDTPVPLRGEAIGWRFHGYEADGERVEQGLPRGGLGHGAGREGQKIRRLP